MLERSLQVEDGPAGPRLAITVPRLWPLAIFLGLWLCGWTAGELSAIKGLCQAWGRGWGNIGISGFLIAWLAGWTAGGLFVWGAFLFSLCGREVLALEQGTFRVRLEASVLSWSWRFELPRMSALRLVVNEFKARYKDSPISARLAYVAFSYEGKKWRLGLGLKEEQARMLLETLRSRFGLRVEESAG